MLELIAFTLFQQFIVANQLLLCVQHVKDQFIYHFFSRFTRTICFAVWVMYHVPFGGVPLLCTRYKKKAGPWLCVPASFSYKKKAGPWLCVPASFSYKKKAGPAILLFRYLRLWYCLSYQTTTPKPTPYVY